MKKKMVVAGFLLMIGSSIWAEEKLRELSKGFLEKSYPGLKKYKSEGERFDYIVDTLKNLDTDIESVQVSTEIPEREKSLLVLQYRSEKEALKKALIESLEEFVDKFGIKINCSSNLVKECKRR